MSDELVKIAIGIGGFLGALLLVGVYILFFPANAQKIGGWIATGAARVFRKVDKTAVALRVQGDINGLRKTLHESAPDVIDKNLKIRWKDAEEAEAVVRGGDVIVFMRDSRRIEENVANALMAFLPKAVLPRARRYVARNTMRAVDLTIAKTLLTHDEAHEGALTVFYESYLDPAREGSDALRTRLAEIDLIDMHGWLSRILLAEFRRVGEMLHPAEPDEACLQEAEDFADWLHILAARKKDELGSLTFRGRYFSVAIIFVAQRDVLADRGIEPYRKRAKRHIYSDRFNSVYLLARDPNLGAVDKLVETLRGDALIAARTRYAYRLRRDFQAKQGLRRETGICVCLRRRDIAHVEEMPSDEDAATALPVERYETATAPLLPYDEPKVESPETSASTQRALVTVGLARSCPMMPDRKCGWSASWAARRLDLQRLGFVPLSVARERPSDERHLLVGVPAVYDHLHAHLSYEKLGRV